jgi:hypothetical protein
VELLRLLEDDGRLKSFKIDETEVTARLSDYSQMTIAVDRLELRIFSPLQSMDAALAAAKSAVEIIGPTTVRMVSADLAHVVEIPGDYSELRQSSGGRLYPWWPARITDWALLVDGVSKNGQTQYKCEFGLVADTEIPDRLTRAAGRMQGPSTNATSLHLDRTRLPKVALFSDSSWQRVQRAPIPGTVWEYFAEFADSTVAEANELVYVLQNAVADTSNSRRKMGAS